MQDTHAIGLGGAGPGRLFAAGGGGGGDRRLRPGQHGGHGHGQVLKCPRCDSLNTKFCYYNNYNLSQPRHFCKSCRRYWTKGGVLRNVPVGGGCRKTKRSKSKQASAAAIPSSEVLPPEKSSNNSHSSSESSSLTATTTAAKKTPPAAGSSSEVASASTSAGNLLNFGDSRFFLPQINGNGNSFDQSQPLIDPIGTSERQMFATDMGSFTSLMTSSNDPGMLSFNPSMADISGFGLQQQEQGSAVDDQNPNQLAGGGGELKMEQQIDCGGYLDQSGHIGFPGLQQNRTSNNGLSDLDWQMNGGGGIGGDDAGGGGEQGLFDFSGTVDQTYWGQNQWSDHDQSLNFPPLV